jgi:hypothetical protein
MNRRLLGSALALSLSVGGCARDSEVVNLRGHVDECVLVLFHQGVDQVKVLGFPDRLTRPHPRAEEHVELRPGLQSVIARGTATGLGYEVCFRLDLSQEDRDAYVHEFEMLQEVKEVRKTRVDPESGTPFEFGK